MSDILKEAIADAKAVRETALQNAKMALEEAFTPQLKSMLSAKLKEDEMGDEEETEETYEDEEMGDEEVPAEEAIASEAGISGPSVELPKVKVGVEDEEGEEEFSDDEFEEGTLGQVAGGLGGAALGGLPGAVVGQAIGDKLTGEDDEVPGDEGEGEGEEEVEEESLDLESVIRELETELSEQEDEEGEEDEEPVEESEEPVEEEYEIDESALEEEEETVDEVDKSSGIGKSDNHKGETDKSSGVGNGDNSLSEVHAELKEYKEAVSFLKDKLHEVNILNAKLLFTNKLFKAYSLNNNQKLKVVETFDRAQTTREIKLVYSTLAEQFGDNGSIARKKSINESASAKSGSTKPSKESRKVITEEAQVANRFKKLAGLIK